MRYYGTIIRWNESRKFGAIREENTESEIFVPLSALNGNPETPAEGQRVSFHIVKGRRGRDEAQDVRFVDYFEDWDNVDPASPYQNRPGQSVPAAGLVLPLLSAAIIGLGGWYGWQAWQNHQAETAALATQKPVSMVAKIAEQMKAERAAWKERIKSSSSDTSGNRHP